MYTPQDWAIAISNAQRQAVDESKMIRPMASANIDRTPDVLHTCAFDQDRMAELERQVEELTTGFNTLTSAVSDMNEELAKAQGMLKFCYAICSNQAVKDLADTARGAARSQLGSLSFGRNAQANSVGRPAPAGRGAGGGWRPSP